ncbi:MAG: hypothetical protein HPY55_04465 [Firmicutes bacterium]|nr:hypothetical protein [Bacillota bacterium]
MAVEKVVVPVIPGDGVGPELAEAARLCVEALNARMGTAVELVPHKAGYGCYLESGTALPDNTVSAMINSRATLIGAITGKLCPPPSPMGQIRKSLGLWGDIRHCVSIPGSPRDGIDIVIIRECSEGFLSDRNMFQGNGEFMPTPDTVISLRVTTRLKCERIAGFAFRYALEHGRKRITVAHKSVVFPLGCGMFRECLTEESKRHPGVVLDEKLIDELAGDLALNPQAYDVIAATNMFGDILSEVVASQVGSIVAIQNVGDRSAVFYPSHGAPAGQAGRNNVNPLAMLRAVCMMMNWLDMPEGASALDAALRGACDETKIGGSPVLPAGVTTSGFVRMVIDRISV